ncbi:37S ribosomal protein [Sporothrix brasiliensis 5110]|uniref:Small ribosomal subunit protein bS18m n=1 Tax=Sporothrix brasiliensis 5110 TaxID=1398154 RepID=A0A0C2IZW8_9PEZI|nr:37S ribosomal protein [Sporothrix brasiliensis 5110]KIH90502.1 37S ribosomal protein [Sporothrix brasiliensis 5110]
MPPRLPTSLAAALSRCSNLFVAPITQRFAVASLHSSARLDAPRTPPSSGASFLDLDNNDEYGRPRPTADGEQGPGRGPATFAPRYGPRSDANAALSRVLFDSETRRRMHERREEQKRTALEKMAERKTTEDYARHLTRRWRVGDLYTAHDLGVEEMHQWGESYLSQRDVIEILGINPIDEYRNFSMISDFVTSTGRIRGSRETALRPVNQRRMAKAVRRAIGMGIHPSVHKHPEILAPAIAAMPRPTYVQVTGSNRKR